MADGQVVLKADAWNKYLIKSGKTLKNIFPVLSVAVNTIGHADIMSHFKQERSPIGRWAPLKSRRGKPLQDTGKLRGSILPARRVGRNSALIIANTDYAGFHNKGTGRIPQREFMWFSKAALAKMLKMIMRKF